MDYKKIYNDLIKKARSENRIKYQDVYYEAHHIIPKCVGGNGHQSQWKFHKNIVLLTAKEHYVAHKLLVNIYDDPKLIKALWMIMVFRNNNNKFVISSREYERVRILFAKQNSIDKQNNKNRLGIKFSKESIEKIRNAQLGTKQKIIKCPYCNKEGGERALKQFHFDNCLKKPGNEHIMRKGKNKKPRFICPFCNKFEGSFKELENWHKKKCNKRPNKPPKKSSISEESNKKRSETMKGQNTSPQKKIGCPHCLKVGGISVMKRHHFENCKLKRI
jgi:hypothetical protein